MDGFAQGITKLWDFKLKGMGCPNFQPPIAARLCIGPPTTFTGVLEVLYDVPSLVGLGLHPRGGRPKTLRFCLSVYVSHAFK